MIEGKTRARFARQSEQCAVLHTEALESPLDVAWQEDLLLWFFSAIIASCTMVYVMTHFAQQDLPDASTLKALAIAELAAQPVPPEPAAAIVLKQPPASPPVKSAARVPAEPPPTPRPPAVRSQPALAARANVPAQSAAKGRDLPPIEVKFDPGVTLFDVVRAFRMSVFARHPGLDGHRQLSLIEPLEPPAVGAPRSDKSVYEATRGRFNIRFDLSADIPPALQPWFREVEDGSPMKVEALLALDTSGEVSRLLEQEINTVTQVRGGRRPEAPLATFGRTSSGAVELIVRPQTLRATDGPSGAR